MDVHKNAQLTHVRRIEMVQGITERGLSVPQASAAHGVSAPTAPKWLGRHLAMHADERTPVPCNSCATRLRTPLGSV